MITLAGNVADGIILDAAPLEYVPYALERLQIGAEARGRSLRDFRFCNLIPFSVSEDREIARNSVRPFVCIDLVSVSKKTLELTGVRRTDVDYVLEKWPDWNASAERVTEEMIDKFTLTGTKEECARKIRDYVDLGVNEFLLCAPMGPTLRGTLEAARDYLMPRFRM
jgi:5,10-methylenetetrahydromethanopterin reductase